MNKILVTGGAGFIGSNLTNKLLKDNKVIVVDDLSMGSQSNLENSQHLTFIEGSVTDNQLMTQLLTEHSFDYIYHLAAVASVADSVERPLETHQVNFDSVLNLLELVRQTQPQLKRLVFASSAAVYGDEPTLPKKEESVIRPLSPYAIDKFAAEKYVLAYNNLYGVPTSAVRFFNVFGPRQNPKSPYSGVISIMIDRFEQIKQGQDTQFTLFGDGEQSRDFIYIQDVLTALELVATKDEAKGNVYNVGNGKVITLNDLLRYLSQTTGVSLPVQHESARLGDIKDSYADNSALKQLGFEAQYTVADGLKDYLSFLEKQ